jgi:hypothetical protein
MKIISTWAGLEEFGIVVLTAGRSGTGAFACRSFCLVAVHARRGIQGATTGVVASRGVGGGARVPVFEQQQVVNRHRRGASRIR